MGLLSAAVLLSSLFTHGTFEDNNQYKSIKDVSLEVWPDSRQHLRGKNFTIRCSGGNSTGWILRRLQEDKMHSGCLQLSGTESTDRHGECHFIDIDNKDNGLYWCESLATNKTSKTINITVTWIPSSTVHPLMKEENSTAHLEDEKPPGSLIWLSGLCIILLLLVIFPLLWLLFPGFREKLYACPSREFRRERVQQEMPKTKQDVTEIQWDLPWMEMDNLLDRQQNPGS